MEISRKWDLSLIVDLGYFITSDKFETFEIIIWQFVVNNYLHEPAQLLL